MSTESAVMRNLYGMVVYKVLKLKVKIDLTFFITLILFGLVTIGKEFLHNREFLKEALL